MQQPRRPGGIDWERVFVVPILVVLLLASSLSLFRQHYPSQGEPTSALMVVYRVLLMAFYLLSVVLLLIRTDAKAKSPGVLPRVAAYAGSFGPFLFSFISGSAATPGLVAVGVALQVAGLAFAVYSLAILRRSFGLAPQVRTLVQRGPYRYIRHPLYVGEFISLIGVILVSPSWLKIAILIGIAAIQLYRVVAEERLLGATDPRYVSYMTTTKRFIPGML